MRMGLPSSDVLIDKVHLREVYINQGGYSHKGNVYWGLGERLFYAYDSEMNEVYFRSLNRNTAKQELMNKFEVKFYR